MGRVSFILLKMILIEPVIGTDRNAPGAPHKSVQKMSEPTTTAGCKSIPSPKKRGSTRLPITNSIALKSHSITQKLGPNPNCKNNTGIGNNTAMIDPTLGMKLRRNANSANTAASFT